MGEMDVTVLDYLKLRPGHPAIAFEMAYTLIGPMGSRDERKTDYTLAISRMAKAAGGSPYAQHRSAAAALALDWILGRPSAWVLVAEFSPSFGLVPMNGSGRPGIWHLATALTHDIVAAIPRPRAAVKGDVTPPCHPAERAVADLEGAATLACPSCGRPVVAAQETIAVV